MTELLKEFALNLLMIYLVIGCAMSIVSYMASSKDEPTSLSDHLINLSFIPFWLPYFYWYFKYIR